MPPFRVGVVVLQELKRLAEPSDAFVWDGSWFGHPGSELIDQYAGTPELREIIDGGETTDRIERHFARDVEQFRAARLPYLMYQ